MALPSFSRTITKILETRGRAGTKAARSKELSSSEAESPSTDMIVGGTTPASPKLTSEPSTSAKTTNELSLTSGDLTRLPSWTVHSFIHGPRPLPALDLSSPAGEYVAQHAKDIGAPINDTLEYMVGWAYKAAPGWGEKSMEELVLFYRDNRPAFWGF